MKKIIRHGAPATFLFLGIFLAPFRPAIAQVEFPIGYSSLGGTYAFISLIEEQRLLEQEGIRPSKRKDLSDELKERILWKNAARLYGLE